MGVDSTYSGTKPGEKTKECFDNNDTFEVVIWSDETSVQLEFHRRHQFRKVNQPPKLKARPKHPVKVHVWAAISKRGAAYLKARWMQLSRAFGPRSVNPVEIDHRVL